MNITGVGLSVIPQMTQGDNRLNFLRAIHQIGLSKFGAIPFGASLMVIVTS